VTVPHTGPDCTNWPPDRLQVLYTTRAHVSQLFWQNQLKCCGELLIQSKENGVLMYRHGRIFLDTEILRLGVHYFSRVETNSIQMKLLQFAIGLQVTRQPCRTHMRCLCPPCLGLLHCQRLRIQLVTLNKMGGCILPTPPCH